MSEVQDIPVDQVQTHPQNARLGDVPLIMRSLERFGQIKPIIVQRSTGYAVAGNHVLEAARRLGWSTVKAMVLDMDDENALAYLVADNRTSDLAEYDEKKLLEVLSKGIGNMEGTGYDEGDLEAIAEELSGKEEERRPQPKQQPLDMEGEEVRGAPEPTRSLTIMIPASQHEEFAGQVRDLQVVWKANTLVEIIRRAVGEAHQRWQAGATGELSSKFALPEELQVTF